jgi:hypothetical protein
MIDWKKYFDHIYCIHYKPHVERFEELNNELKRVGILDSEIFNYLFTNEDNSEYIIPANKVTINHKYCLMHAYENNYNRILILENDIRFLNNISIIENYLYQIPKDADMVWFDYIYGFEFEEIDRYKKLNINIPFINIGKEERIFSAACYMCSRKMQEHLIECYNKYQTTPDYFTWYNPLSPDQEIDKTINRYIVSKNIAIQKVFDNNLRATLHGKNNTYERYTYQGLNLEDYNI